MKKNLMICHGNITHPYEEMNDCMECIEMNIEYLQMLKKVGGEKKLKKELDKKVELL